MRRQRGEGSVFHRSDGRWVAVLDLGWHEGGRRRKVVYAKTQREAVKRLGVLKLEAAKGATLLTPTTTVGKWLTYWLDNIAARRVKPRTLVSYRTCVDQYLIPALGKRRLDKLRPEHVDEMHRYVEGKGLSSTTGHNAHRVLHAALEDAVRRDLTTRNVAGLVTAPPKAARTRTGLTASQAKTLLRSVAEDRLASRWLAAFLTGARQGELLGLRWEYVDFGRGIVDLAWSLQRIPYAHGCQPPCGKKRAFMCPARRLAVPPGFEYIVLHGNQCLTRPKTAGSRRVVPLAPPLLAALLLRREASEIERGTYTQDHDLVWCEPTGQPIDAADDWTAWKTHLAAAGLPSVTLHEARHSTATLLLDAGIDTHIIASILGHSDVVTTRGYQHVDLTMQRQALDAAAEALQG